MPIKNRLLDRIGRQIEGLLPTVVGTDRANSIAAEPVLVESGVWAAKLTHGNPTLEAMTMNKTRGMFVTLAAILTLAGCAPGEDAETGGAEDGDDLGSMEGMQDMDRMGEMAGMEGGSMDMMAGMQAHMEMMRGMSGDSVQGMLATHRQMMGNMIAQMNREMGDMNMAADASWNATVDSLRADLTTMPDMDPAELQALMPEHHRRAMRLMEMHRAMMADMQM